MQRIIDSVFSRTKAALKMDLRMKNANANKTEVNAETQAPSLALPDAGAARRAVGRWLRAEIGDGLYPAEVSFVSESFAWHVCIWLSTAMEPMVAPIADVYLSAATGEFLGRPTRDDLLRRLEQITERKD